MSGVKHVRPRLLPWASVGFLALLASAAAIASALTPPGRKPVSPPSTSTSSTTLPGVRTSCSAPPGSPSITLSDISPTPTVVVRVGQELLVKVPPWHFGNATTVAVEHPSLFQVQCSVLLPDRGRTTVLLALGAGESRLSATITPPTEALMPAWVGTVNVTAAT